MLLFVVLGVGGLGIFLVSCCCRMMSDYKVEMVNDGMQEFFVEFRGPTESTIAHANSDFVFPPPGSWPDDPRFLFSGL